MIQTPRISIVIPVLREGDGINDLIAHTRGIDGGQEAEIIVVDGDPSLSTLSVINDRNVVSLGSPRGRAVQMNTGAGAATGDILLFLHADTRLPLARRSRFG